jgi:hypothetical protein
MKAINLPQLSILLFFIAQVVFIFYLRHQSLQQMESRLQKAQARRAWNGLLLFFGLFISLISYMSVTGFFGERTFPPRFPLLLIPHFLLMFWMFAWKVKDKLSFLQIVPPALLVVIQFYRFLLEFVVLALYRQEIVPVEITFEGRSFDLLVGLTSLVTAYLLHVGVKNAVGIGITFNIFGLASLVNIIFTAATSFPSPFQLYATNYLPTYFPGVLIPGFVAPFAVYMHVLSLKQLLHHLVPEKKGIRPERIFKSN